MEVMKPAFLLQTYSPTNLLLLVSYLENVKVKVGARGIVVG
jgi:hypothetical protein